MCLFMIVPSKLRYRYLLFNLVNCEWGQWIGGPCSATCGSKGVQSNTRVKTRIEANGGTCLGSSTTTIGCNRIECPSNIHTFS